MRYPKAGYPNPKVRLRVFDLERYLDLTKERKWKSQDDVGKATKELVLENPFKEDDVVISEVVWVGENELIVKATNRIATVERVARFVFGEDDAMKDERIVVGKVVREVDFEKLDGGWAEPVSTKPSTVSYQFTEKISVVTPEGFEHRWDFFDSSPPFFPIEIR